MWKKLALDEENHEKEIMTMDRSEAEMDERMRRTEAEKEKLELVTQQANETTMTENSQAMIDKGVKDIMLCIEKGRAKVRENSILTLLNEIERRVDDQLLLQQFFED